MLRTFLLLIALLILIGIVLVATGAINLRQDGNGAVSIETKDVQVGTTTANVQVPVVKMETRQVSVPSVGVENSQANAQ
jgi:preprotein translocase subunit SecF